MSEIIELLQKTKDNNCMDQYDVFDMSTEIRERCINRIERILENHMLDSRADCCNRKDYGIVYSSGYTFVAYKGKIIGGVRMLLVTPTDEIPAW